ncbi:LysR family transcriptional regulator [Telmatospirillum sp. J64-1]|uniref:LysR family transcriptional regulator n=1 Tax=Telmatospirillum sp. J64-1 TaxID=2502183 RepID=UPI002105C640|nr:LysR family transcriptional regulator [Telmatospirillum sp. J64-1]
MPDLEDIQIFNAVVESGSLTQAATRLGMSKSVVSRRLAKLEADLGTPLLARTTRGLSLTEAGVDFRPFAERMIADLQAARDALSRQGEATGRLRIAAPTSFGNSHLAPVLAELALRHPRLEINCAYSDRLVDLIREGFDAAVRIGALADSTLIARRIAPISAVLVASPAYLARNGKPATPADLANHDAIPHGEATWQFRHKGRTFTHRPRGRFIADSGPAELAAVIAGLGIAMMPTFLAGPAIKRGEVVTVLDDYEIPEVGLYIVRPPPAEPVPNKVRLLTDILVEKFGNHDWDRCPRRQPQNAAANATAEHGIG